jgi:putative addiction module CopG family antidote
MTVTLAPELEKLLLDRLASGRYNSPEEVLSSALWLLSARDHLVEQRKEELRHKIAKAREAAPPGDLAEAVKLLAAMEQDESPL